MSTPQPSAATAEQWEPKYPFDLVVAYEDLPTRNQAMRLHDQLARQLQDDYDLQCTWWKFGHLEEPELRDRAADAAAEADMVILSVHAASELPGRARAWMDDWARRRDRHKSALVALVNGVQDRREEAKHLLATLQQVARKGCMDFFPHLDAGEPITPRPCSCGLTERASAVTPTLLEILHHRSPAPRESLHQP